MEHLPSSRNGATCVGENFGGITAGLCWPLYRRTSNGLQGDCVITQYFVTTTLCHFNEIVFFFWSQGIISSLKMKVESGFITRRISVQHGRWDVCWSVLIQSWALEQCSIGRKESEHLLLYISNEEQVLLSRSSKWTCAGAGFSD